MLFLSAAWTLVLTAPIKMQVIGCYISEEWRNRPEMQTGKGGKKGAIIARIGGMLHNESI